MQKFGREFVISVAANLAATGIIGPPPPVLPPNPPPVIEQVRPDINKMVQDLASNGGGKITIKSNGAEITIEIPDRE